MKLYKLEDFDLGIWSEAEVTTKQLRPLCQNKGNFQGPRRGADSGVCLGSCSPWFVLLHLVALTSLSLVVHKFMPQSFFHFPIFSIIFHGEMKRRLFEVLTIQVHPLVHPGFTVHSGTQLGLRLIGPGTSRSAGIAESTGAALQTWPGAWSAIWSRKSQ